MRRASGLAAIVACVVGAGTPARAAVFDFMTEVLTSRPMPKVPGDENKDKPRAVVLNGFPMYVTTGRTAKSVSDVLDYYQTTYPGGAMGQMIGHPVGARQETDDSGSLLTADVPDKGTALELVDGKRSLVSAGPVRLVYAHRKGMFTEYLVAWSDKAMPPSILDSVQSGDSPGQDLPGIPRPLGVRSFTFSEPAAGYALAAYKVAGPPEVALRTVAMRLSSGGWTEDAAFAIAANKRHQLVVRFAKANRDLVVAARPAKDDPHGAKITYLARDQ